MDVIRKIFSIRFLDFVPYTILSIVLFVYFWDASVLAYLGLSIWTIGLALWFAGLISIGKYFHGFPEPKGLVTTGVYSKIRNPIYLGGFLVFVGVSIFTQHLLIIAITLLQIPLQISRILVEHKHLEQKYGEKYLEYLKQTWL